MESPPCFRQKVHLPSASRVKSIFQCLCFRSRWLKLPALWRVLPLGSLLHWWLLELCLTTKVLLLLRHHWHVMLLYVVVQCCWKLSDGWFFSISSMMRHWEEPWMQYNVLPLCYPSLVVFCRPRKKGIHWTSATCQARAEAMQRWVDEEEMAAVAVFGLEEEQLKNLCANMEPGGTMVKQPNLLVVFVWRSMYDRVAVLGIQDSGDIVSTSIACININHKLQYVREQWKKNWLFRVYIMGKL